MLVWSAALAASLVEAPQQQIAGEQRSLLPQQPSSLSPETSSSTIASRRRTGPVEWQPEPFNNDTPLMAPPPRSDNTTVDGTNPIYSV